MSISLERYVRTYRFQNPEQIRIKLSCLFVCCFLLLACNQVRPRSAYPEPPADSYRIQSVDLVVKNTTHTIRGAFVTPQFFKATRANPMLGRDFIEDDYQPEHQGNYQRVIVLSHKLWQESTGSSPDIIGGTVKLGGQTYTVVGVMPKKFNIPEGVDVWLPEAETSR